MLNTKNLATLPTHIAFIMDGNRRWATRRGLSKDLGHKAGSETLKEIISELSEIEGIKYASFFAFSTENWNRDKKEIDYLFNLVYNYIGENEKILDEKNIKFVAMGDLTRFPQDLQEKLKEFMKRTENNTGLVVNLAVNYGGREDIVQSVNKLVEQNQEITLESIKQNLYSSQDIDLLVRTSGEQRISNFMLYQLAYSEIYFTKTCWPDFDKKQLYKALKEFSKRTRTFGGN